MNVIGIVLTLCLIGFIVYQTFGIFKDLKKRKEKKLSGDDKNSNKEDKGCQAQH